MKFGLCYCNTGLYVDPVRAVELTQAAEAAGFEFGVDRGTHRDSTWLSVAYPVCIRWSAARRCG